MRFGNRDSYRTNFGGCLSLLIHVVILIYGVQRITRVVNRDDTRLTTTRNLSPDKLVSFKGNSFTLTTVIQKIDTKTGHAESVFIPEDVGHIQLVKLVSDDLDKMVPVKIQRT